MRLPLSAETIGRYEQIFVAEFHRKKSIRTALMAVLQAEREESFSPEIDNVIRLVSQATGIEISVLRSPRRKDPKIARARWICIWVLTIGDVSSTDIAQALRLSSHASCNYGLEQIDRMDPEDPNKVLAIRIAQEIGVLKGDDVAAGRAA